VETIQIVDRDNTGRLRDRGIGIYKFHWVARILVKNLWTLNIARSGPCDGAELVKRFGLDSVKRMIRRINKAIGSSAAP